MDTNRVLMEAIADTKFTAVPKFSRNLHPVDVKNMDTDKFKFTSDTDGNKSTIKNALLRLAKYASFNDKKNQTQFKPQLTVSNRINSIYSSISTVLSNNISYRKQHKNDTVSGTYMYLNLYDKAKKEYYQFQYMQLYIPIDEVAYNIKLNIKRDTGNNHRNLKGYVDGFIESLRSGYWYILDTEPTIVESKPIVSAFETHVSSTKDSADDVFLVLNNATYANEYESLYISIMQKQYDELEFLYGNNKDIMGIIDELFNQCIKYTEGAIINNQRSITLLGTILQHYLDQLERFYNIIK